MRLLASLTSCGLLLAACATSPSAEAGPLTAAAVGGGNIGPVEVATSVSAPLRVVVRQGGLPRAGVSVAWATTSGSVAPASSMTDADGIATSHWTVGTVATRQAAWATATGAEGVPRFTAEVTAGPPHEVSKVSGDGQRVGATAVWGYDYLKAKVVDRYGNSATTAEVAWSVEGGPLILPDPAGRDQSGSTVILPRGTGGAGAVQVRVAVKGTPLHATFNLEAVEGVRGVGLVNPSYTTVGFRSYQNRSLPAVDTLPVGATMTWAFRDYWDVVTWNLMMYWPGLPEIPDCAVAPELDHFCRITFDTPGTFTYSLAGPPFAMGTIIVR